MSIIDRLRDPEILNAMSVGEKLWGAVVVMIIGLVACMVALTVIMYSIKLMHVIFSPREEKEEKGGDNGQVRLEPGDFDDGATVITCPADGKVTALNAAVGAAVRAGDVLLILNAFNCDNEIIAPADGVISRILAEEGNAVRKGEALVVM